MVGCLGVVGMGMNSFIIYYGGIQCFLWQAKSSRTYVNISPEKGQKRHNELILADLSLFLKKVGHLKPYTYDSKKKFNFWLGQTVLRVDLGSLDPKEPIFRG